MSKYYPKPHRPFCGNIKVKIDLSNYATKTDIKNISHVDTSSFALKTNLSSSKTEVDKLDIDKLVPVSVDLSKLSDAVKNGVVKKTAYDKSVAKVSNNDTSRFVLKTNMIQINQNQKIKFQILAVLLKRQIIILKWLIFRVKFLMLVIQQQKPH